MNAPTWNVSSGVQVASSTSPALAPTRSDDLAWNYVTLVLVKTNQIICMYCNKCINGGGIKI